MTIPESTYQPRPEMAWLLGAVTAVTNLPSSVILGPGRTARVSTYRQAGYYVARHVLGWSWPEIGRAFNRGHQPVLVGCRRIEGRMICEPHLAHQIQAITDCLRVFQEAPPEQFPAIGNFSAHEIVEAA